MGKHHHTPRPSRYAGVLAAVRSWAARLRRPIVADDESECERTQPIPVVIDAAGPNERTLPLTGVLIPLREPPDEWIPPAVSAHQHSGGAVQR